MNSSFNLDHSASNTLILSKELSPMNDIITREAFLVSLFLYPDTPLNHFMRDRGVNRYDIMQRSASLLKDSYTEPKSYLQFRINDLVFRIDSELSSLFQKAIAISEEYGKGNVSSMDFIEAFKTLNSAEYNKYLRTLFPESKLSTLDEMTKEDIEALVEDIFNDDFKIPSEMQLYLTDLTSKYVEPDKECNICGRDAEIKHLVQILLKAKKRNAVLVGDPGVGKTAIVEKLTWMIRTGNCPYSLKDSVIVSLDVTSIIAGTTYRGMAEQRFNDLVEFLEENPNCILFIDEIHLLLGAGACFEGAIDLANSLKPILARGSTRVIGATTEEEYNKYFSKDGALKRRFEKITVEEPLSTEVYPMIENQIKYLEKEHNVEISKLEVEKAILYASCFTYETKNPDRTLDLIDRSLANAKLAGKPRVTQKDILDNFEINKKKFKNMSYSQKMATAYHEAGHYILCRYSSELTNMISLAVSIMPTENYLGINVREFDKSITPSCNRAYYTQIIAVYLAGRLAEEMYSSQYTSGAQDDLEKATELATLVITQYGLDEISRARVYSPDSCLDIPSDEISHKVNEQINHLLKEANIYAKKVLSEHNVQLKALSEALVKSGIMSEKEISDLFKKIDAKKS